jgi:hypothetical protein
MAGLSTPAQSGGPGDRARRAARSAADLTVMLGSDEFVDMVWGKLEVLPASEILEDLVRARDLLAGYAADGGA